MSVHVSEANEHIYMKFGSGELIREGKNEIYFDSYRSKSCDSSVGTVTDYGLDDRMIGV
jgi:hypothetical protein